MGKKSDKKISYTKQQLLNAIKFLYNRVLQLEADNANLNKQIEELKDEYKFCDPYDTPAIGAPNDW